MGETQSPSIRTWSKKSAREAIAFALLGFSLFSIGDFVLDSRHANPHAKTHNIGPKRPESARDDDAAKTILDPAQISQAMKADAWEAFHSAQNEAELQVKLNAIEGLPNSVKADLQEAKRRTTAGATEGGIFDRAARESQANQVAVNALIRNPEFLGLQGEEQRRILSTFDSRFADLKPWEYYEFLARMKKGSDDAVATGKAGSTENQVLDYLRHEYPSFDLDGALKAGYSKGEIIEYLSIPKTQRNGWRESVLAWVHASAVHFAIGATYGLPVGLMLWVLFWMIRYSIFA
jgi:hypothetical protein